MEVLTIPCGKWFTSAGKSGRRARTSPGAKGEEARAGSPSVLVSLRATGGIQHHGVSVSPVFPRRGGGAAATVVPAFAQRSSAFSSAEQPQKADIEADTPKSGTQTARELLQTAAQTDVTEIQNQAVDRSPTEVAKTKSVEVDEFLKADTEMETEVQTQTEIEPLQSAAKTQSVEVDQLPKADTEMETEVQAQTEIQPLQSEAEITTVQQVQDQVPDVSRTVRVKFMLQKSCEFGEQFLVAGEDPNLGLWNPACALPLDWSDPDVWTGEQFFRAGENVKFKFILKTLSGKIKWQPGADRVLQTWDTTNAIVVEGDWENALDSKITEGPLATPVEGEIPEESKISGADGEGGIEESQAVATRDSEQKEVESLEVKASVQEEDPVLVPGLASLPLASTQGASSLEGVTDGIIDDASRASEEIGSKTSEVNVW